MLQGLYVLRLFWNGRWTRVLIDDRIPCSKEDGSPLFGSCHSPCHTWVMLIEKAVAKLHGSYESLAKVTRGVRAGLEMLTGGAVFPLDLSPITQSFISQPLLSAALQDHAAVMVMVPRSSGGCYRYDGMKVDPEQDGAEAAALYSSLVYPAISVSNTAEKAQQAEMMPVETLYRQFSEVRAVWEALVCDHLSVDRRFVL